MIVLLLPLRWMLYDSAVATPSVHRDADVYSYHYVAPIASVFLVPAGGQADVVAEDSVYVVPSTRSVYP